MRCATPCARMVLTAALGCLLGCGGEAGVAPRPRVTVHPVVGKLLVNGEPAARAMIAFHPLGTADLQAVRPVAVTEADGTFRLRTYEPGDGAPAGEYAVTVIWPDDSLPHDECVDGFAHDRFRGRYTDPAASPWRITVTAGYSEVPLEVATGWSSPRRRDLPGK